MLRTDDVNWLIVNWLGCLVSVFCAHAIAHSLKVNSNTRWRLCLATIEHEYQLVAQKYFHTPPDSQLALWVADEPKARLMGQYGEGGNDGEKSENPYFSCWLLVIQNTYKGIRSC